MTIDYEPMTVKEVAAKLKIGRTSVFNKGKTDTTFPSYWIQGNKRLYHRIQVIRWGLENGIPLDSADSALVGTAPAPSREVKGACLSELEDRRVETLLLKLKYSASTSRVVSYRSLADALMMSVDNVSDLNWLESNLETLSRASFADYGYFIGVVARQFLEGPNNLILNLAKSLGIAVSDWKQFEIDQFIGLREHFTGQPRPEGVPTWFQNRQNVFLAFRQIPPKPQKRVPTGYDIELTARYERLGKKI